MSAPIVVTGATGWIGAAVLRAAARVGPAAGVGRDDAIGRVLDATRPRAVVHAVGRLEGSEAELLAANRDALRTVLAACADRGIAFVSVGSAAEYGDPGDVARIDERAPEAPVTAYGRSKRAGTDAVREARASGAVAVSARLFNVAGPGLDAGRPLGELVERVRSLDERGGTAELELADGRTVRDWVTLRFAAEALVALAVAPPPEAVVHVCSGRATTMAELAVALGRATGRTMRVLSRDDARGPRRVVGDPTLLARRTGLSESAGPEVLAAAALGLAPDRIEPDQIA